jgi:hypothetical protein
MGQDSQYDAGACSYVTEISTADWWRVLSIIISHDIMELSK